MRFLLDVYNPIPKQLNETYHPFGYYNFGVFCWIYDGYDGQVEFINTMHFCSEPKYSSPSAYRIHLARGVIANMQVIPTIRTDTADSVIAGVIANLVTGKGMPLKIPP